jgi:2-polyprenyl-3-methyl-5-hydroxy-6-metoxy-1,4-benzoquinol methylase
LLQKIGGGNNMVKHMKSEKQMWDKVKGMFHEKQICLGKHWSYNLFHDPKRLAFDFSRYKFAARIASKNKKILELGCSEGIGGLILSEFASQYVGIDIDGDSINAANRNWASKKRRFIADDILGKKYGTFDVVVSLDVVEHIIPKLSPVFFSTLYANVSFDGIAIVGTPNAVASKYASKASRLGHVNLLDSDRLREAMEKLFNIVFIFGANDELIHTGFLPMSHYLICVGCGKKRKGLKNGR